MRRERGGGTICRVARRWTDRNGSRSSSRSRPYKQESAIPKNARQVKCGSEKHRPLLSAARDYLSLPHPPSLSLFLSAAKFHSCLARRIIGGTPDVLPSARANRETDRNKQREHRGVGKKRRKSESSNERERGKKISPRRSRTQVATTTLRSGILISNEDKQEESPPRKND